MKKIRKTQKAKIVETAKTIVIVLLLLSSIFFCSKIFETYREQATGDGLWGQKNSISTGQNLNNIAKDGIVNEFMNISKPTEIVLNRDKIRKIIPHTLAEFDDLAMASANLIKDVYALSGDRAYISDYGEWKNSLNKDSVYIKYPSRRPVWFESEIYQAKGYIYEALKAYDEILVLMESDEVSAVFFRDRVEDNIIKIKPSGHQSDAFKNAFKKYEDELEKDCVFAWEKGLDENNYNDAMLDEMMILPEGEMTAHDITADITRVYKAGLNFTKSTEFANELISVFAYNPNTVRQYMSNDDSLIFVGETGSLSVRPEGKIEYKALGTNEGVLLATDGQMRPAAILTGLSGLIQRIFEISGINKENRDFDIKITKMTSDIQNPSKIEICFDYFVGGTKLVFSDAPAIYANIENGVLVEFFIEVRDIQTLDNKSTIESVFEKIDNFNTKYPKSNAVIDGQKVYKCLKNGEKVKSEWEVFSVR